MKYLATSFAVWAFVGSFAFAQESRSDTDKDRRDEARRSGQRRLLVSKGQEGWRYLDTKKAPPKAWTNVDFDDSEWKEGRAPLGYGEEDVATELDYGGDSELKFPAAFFRRKFDAQEIAEIYAGRIRADDGAVIYLNGREIKRLRMPEGEIDHAAYSREVMSSSSEEEGEFVLFRIDPKTFAEGENVLCVSVHQARGASSDLIFDMELLGLSKENLARLEKSAESRRMAARRRYGRRQKVEVKDPAEFNTSREKPLFSGPQAGEKLPPLKATGIRGETDGKEIEIVAEAGENPHVLIFQTVDPAAECPACWLYGVSALMARIANKSEVGLRTSVVFLDDDAAALSKRVEGIAKALPEEILLAVSRDGREGPGVYGLNRNAAMTVLVAKEGKVIHNFAFQQPLLTVDPHILGAIAEAIDEKRETLEKRLNEDPTEGERMRRGDARGRERTDERGQATERKRYENRRRVEVKDPAEFNKTQEKVLFSGPQPGEKLPFFKATGVRDALDGEEFDAVSMAGGKPQILIFQDETGVGIRGLRRLTRLLSRVENKSDQDLHTAVVFLGDDPAKITKFVKDLGRIIPGDLLVGVSRDGRDGPGAYGLNRNVSQTIIFSKDRKVTHSFVFPQGMLLVDPHVLGAVAALIGEERETLETWLNEERAEGERTRRGERRRERER